MEIKQHIRDCLAALEPRRLSNGFTREAAVLMPLMKWENQYHFLLTRRTEEVQTHKGQISFPGGMRENGETLANTALRETFEEVGIHPDRVEILGRFHDYISVTRYRVTPFAGFVRRPFAIRPQATEVAEVLRVPFNTFLDRSRLRTEKRVVLGREEDVYYYSHGNHEVWGLTARIIKDFIEILSLKP
jgi:8-oxo-dGTP pyrophosphatase MutT (NUDIX family)